MNTTFHQATHPSWSPSHARPPRQQRDAARSRRTVPTRATEKKVKERRMPIISYREVIAAWALILVVGAILFGADLMTRDTATACTPRVVAPETHIPSAESAYDHGERLDRLDWDRDINNSGTPASAQIGRPCPL